MTAAVIALALVILAGIVEDVMIRMSRRDGDQNDW